MSRFSFTLYTTEGCHLCEQADAIIQQYPYCVVTKVDIVDDDDLMATYGIRIPVLKHDNSDRELSWPFDADSVRKWLSQIRPESL